MRDQKELFLLNNQNLFSNNYLEHRLPFAPLWNEQKEMAQEAFEAIKKSYEITDTLGLGPGQEAELEDKFIRPVLKELGYVYSVQPTTKRGFKKKRPDYALFKDSYSLNAAIRDKDNPKKFFSYALTILESKYWGRRLNDTDRSDILDSRDPTAQTVKYLEDVHFHTEGKINWAILTNGKVWRLFYYRATSRSGNFFEIDLEEIIKSNEVEKFLYFYLVFSKNAFIPDIVTGKTWLDQYLEGSEAYAKAVSERLKDLIFDKILEGLAEGFVHHRRIELNITEETEDSRKEIFKGCLTLLYRLLFLLYAESRNLLPISEEGYYRASLSKLKRDIHKDLSTIGIDKMSKRSYTYWARIEGLSKIIAEGEPDLNVPVYNGGLFETTSDCFLALYRMSDPFLADAIELLTVDSEGNYSADITPFIDYSSLSVRHLGDIYEGLLEFHIQIADEETVEVKESDRFIWKRLSKVKKGTKTYRQKKKCEVYIENSKHERKATGSYYTPHYIVEYIVKNTIGHVLDERLNYASEILIDLESMYEKQRKELKKSGDWKHWDHPGEPTGKNINEIIKKECELFENLFDIKVLDPAMGSGHFLVHAVDFISDRIISFLAKYPENPVIAKIEKLKREILHEINRQGVRIDESKLTEVNLIKRMVMKRCIYGIDLNEMAVELAKLSLWLDSFTLGAPLSFLDHHLKCGNSLIGILDIAIVIIPGTETYSKMQRALSFMLQVSELTDSTISEAKKSYDLFKRAQAEIDPIKRRFDVATAKHFTDLGDNIGNIEVLAYSLNFDREPYPINIERCKKAFDISKEKRFFHWRLEFPEVFYTERGEKKNPGFDCVIGNPPYINVEEISSDDRNFLMNTGAYTTTIKRMDIFIPFHELSIKLLRTNGRHSFIVPFPLLTQDYGQRLRVFFLNNTVIKSIVDLSKHKIFPAAVVKNIIPIFEKQTVKTDYAIEIVTQDEDPNETQKIYGPRKLIGANQFMDTYENMFRIDLTPELHHIQKKIDKKSIKFGKILAASWGARGVPVEKFHLDKPVNKHCKEMIKGANVARYGVSYSGKWLLYDLDKLYRPSMSEFFENPKIIFQKVTGEDGLIGVFDKEKFYTDDSLICCIPKHCFTGCKESELRKHKIYVYEGEAELSRGYDILFVLAVMNSRVNGFYFSRFVGYDLNVYPENIEYLPIPRISFTTPKKQRERIFQEVVKLHHAAKNEAIIKWAKDELSENRNDTIHDFLAFLAEQMIDVNKAMINEVKGFLIWLEREIGTEIEELKNKTAIREYHEHSFEHLLEALRKNKKEISVDPSNRKTQELLEKHFINSMSTLDPLKAKIEITDELIDNIVYRLYGLTGEEVKIVQGR